MWIQHGRTATYEPGLNTEKKKPWKWESELSTFYFVIVSLVWPWPSTHVNYCTLFRCRWNPQHRMGCSKPCCLFVNFSHEIYSTCRFIVQSFGVIWTVYTLCPIWQFESRYQGWRGYVVNVTSLQFPCRVIITGRTSLSVYGELALW